MADEVGFGSKVETKTRTTDTAPLGATERSYDRVERRTPSSGGFWHGFRTMLGVGLAALVVILVVGFVVALARGTNFASVFQPSQSGQQVTQTERVVNNPSPPLYIPADQERTTLPA